MLESVAPEEGDPCERSVESERVPQATIARAALA